jgi:hypothetical protein
LIRGRFFVVFNSARGEKMAVVFIAEVIAIVLIFSLMSKQRVHIAAIFCVSLLVASSLGYFVAYRGSGAATMRSNLTSIDKQYIAERGFGLTKEEQERVRAYLLEDKSLRKSIISVAVKDTFVTIVPAFLVVGLFYRKKLFGNVTTNSNTLKKPSETETTKQDSHGWYCVLDEERKGPFPTSAIKDSIKHGQVNRTTLVWTEGMSDWLPADKTKLARFFKVSPPPLPNKKSVASSVSKPAPPLQAAPKMQPKPEPKKYPFKCLRCLKDFESDKKYCVSCETDEFVVDR